LRPALSISSFYFWSLEKKTEVVHSEDLTTDVNSGHETLFDAATSLA
jgi:hypothetical protein